MIPRALEDDDEARGQRGPDILAEEKERRLRQRRGLRALWLGNWLTGRAGVIFLCLFLVAGLGWMGFQRMAPGRSDVDVHASVAGSLPERVRDLTASEHALASGYGEPLYVGPGGLPVVRVESTGQVREMTSFEAESVAPFVYLSSPRGRIVESPGPRGHGMWWLDRSEESSLRPLVSFDRRAWLDRQEAELGRTVQGISAGIGLLRGLELEIWEPGYGLPILELSLWIRDPYPSAHFGHWSGVPALWVCDGVLELDLHQGVGPGCPGDEYMDALRDAWFSAGEIVDRMEGIGRFVHWMDGMSSADLYESNVRMELAYEMLDLFQDYQDLELSLARLRGVSREWGLAITVDFVGGG